MSEFLVGSLFGFLIGFVLGAVIVGASRVCEWIKQRRGKK